MTHAIEFSQQSYLESCLRDGERLGRLLNGDMTMGWHTYQIVPPGEPVKYNRIGEDVLIVVDPDGISEFYKVNSPKETSLEAVEGYGRVYFVRNDVREDGDWKNELLIADGGRSSIILFARGDRYGLTAAHDQLFIVRNHIPDFHPGDELDIPEGRLLSDYVVNYRLDRQVRRSA